MVYYRKDFIEKEFNGLMNRMQLKRFPVFGCALTFRTHCRSRGFKTSQHKIRGTDSSERANNKKINVTETCWVIQNGSIMLYRVSRICLLNFRWTNDRNSSVCGLITAMNYYRLRCSNVTVNCGYSIVCVKKCDHAVFFPERDGIPTFNFYFPNTMLNMTTLFITFNKIGTS